MKTTTAQTRLTGIIISFLFFLLLPALACSRASTSSLLPQTNKAPEFTLINQKGEMTSLSDMQGKVVILTFLYTNCPSACPAFLQKIETTMANLGDIGENVTVAVITVDPRRDTVARLAEYAAAMPPDWQYLTGAVSELQTVWDAYRINVRQLSGNGQGYEVAHTIKTLVIDKQGFLRLDLSGEDWQASELSELVRQLN